MQNRNFIPFLRLNWIFLASSRSMWLWRLYRGHLHSAKWFCFCILLAFYLQDKPIDAVKCEQFKCLSAVYYSTQSSHSLNTNGIHAPDLTFSCRTGGLATASSSVLCCHLSSITNVSIGGVSLRVSIQWVTNDIYEQHRVDKWLLGAWSIAKIDIISSVLSPLSDVYRRWWANKSLW